ncbi:MAG: YhdP family protein [Pseudomonadota bacterium]
MTIRRRLSQLRSFAWTAFAMCAIGLAVLVGVASLLLPYADRWQPEVSDWLAERLGQPVSVGSLAGRWEGRGPRLSLQNIAVGSGRDLLMIENAEVSLDALAWLRPSQGVAHFRVLVDEVVLTRSGEGGWRVQGLPGFAGSPGAVDLGMLAGMGLRADRLSIRDEASAAQISFDGLDVDVSTSGAAVRFSGVLRLADESLRLMAETSRNGLRLYAASSGLTLERWLGDLPLIAGQSPRGSVSGELWSHVAAGRLTDLEWSGSVEDLTLEDAGVTLLGAAARFSRTDTGWVGQLLEGEVISQSGPWPASGVSLGRDGDTYSLAADWLPLADLAVAARASSYLSEPWQNVLEIHQPAGTLRQLNVSFSSAGDRGPRITGSTEIENLAWRAAGVKPGLSGLNARLELFGSRATLTPKDTGPVTLDTGEVLRWPLELEDLKGHADLSWGAGSGWRLELPQFEVTHQSVRTSSRLVLEGNGGRPFVDLALRVLEGQVADARYYWPHNKWNAKLISWLDEALLGGQVTGGAAVIYGDMDDWPFREGEGRFEAMAIVEEGRMEFDPLWPVAENLEASLNFTTRGMSGRATSGQLMGVDAADVEVELAAYKQPILKVSAAGQAGGNEYLNFLRATPLNDRFATYLEGLSIEGPARTRVDVALPLKPGLPPLAVTGQAVLEDARVSDTKWDMTFEQASGTIEFSESGIRAQALDTLWNGFPAVMDLRTGAFVTTADLAAEAMLTGVAPASVFTQRLPQLAPLLARIPEACEWVARLEVGEDGSLVNSGQSPRLTVASRLAGSEILLPAPLSKASGDDLPLTLDMDLPEMGNVALDVADVLKLRFRRGAEDEPWGGTVHLGPGEPAVNPEPGLLVEGELDFLDLDEWQDFLGEFLSVDLPADDQRWLTAMDLNIRQLRFAYRDFTNLRLKTARDDEYWTLEMQGDQVEGTLRVPINPDSRRLLLAELDKLSWPTSSEELGSPSIDPGTIPPLRFVADNVDFDGVYYGSVSFESYPVRDGMHIDHLETRSDAMAISATGDWLKSGDTPRSRFGLTITGDELGQIFESFGYSQLVEGGQTIVRLDVNWAGGPSDFELANLNGDMDVRITNGQIVEVDPGAGRIFGLMSLQALPRRLTLDFSDLFKAGLTFDVIEGNFLLENGNAFSDNLTIKGPTADIEIKGRTGFAEQDYDQVVTVIPEVGSTLPIVGALAGGGAGAAAAFLLQSVFDRQIDRISQFHYSVTGTFEEPQVELIGADDQTLELETARALRREADRQSG